MTLENILNNSNFKGKIDYDVPLAPLTWFKVGGHADAVYRAFDTDDLGYFLQNIPQDMPVTVFGAASNLLIRDGGIRGVVLRLGRHFGQIERLNETDVLVGAAVPDLNASKYFLDQSLDGGAFLRGIPGTIGGALKMNAGAYGQELKDIFVEAYGVTRQGKKVTLGPNDMGFSYRHSAVPSDIIFTGVKLRLKSGDQEVIAQKMQEITNSRQETQPVKSKTSGSTFKNPQGHKAWQLIDQAGLRGYQVGDAQVSELHCNFMLNNGNATAYDLEMLGETIRKIVHEKTGIKLEWEIKRIGEFGDHIVKPSF